MTTNTAKLIISEPVEAKADHGDGGDKPMTKGEIRRFKKLAGMIRDDAHFAAILQTVGFDDRRKIYNQIAPYLNFTPSDYEDLRFY